MSQALHTSGLPSKEQRIKRRFLIRSHLFVLVIAPASACTVAGTFYVAPGGNNDNAGTSADEAWATLQFAADRQQYGRQRPVRVRKVSDHVVRHAVP